MSDELRSFGIAERAEDGNARKDARDCFGVHGAERYARACACLPKKSEIALGRSDEGTELGPYDRPVCVASHARSLDSIQSHPKTCR